MASSSARSLSKIPSASSSRKNRPTTTAIPSAPTSTSSPPTSGDLAPQVRTFSDLAAYTLDSATITGRGHATLASVAIVTPNFFSVLGTRATFGRTFTAADPQPNTNRLAVVSHSYWQTELGGAASVIGQTVTANRIPFTIVGVMPPDFAFPREADFWVTSATDVPEHALGQSFDFAGRGNYLRTIVGRLAPHATARDAEAELTSILSQLPNPNNIQRNVHLVNLRDHTLGDTRPALAILLACVGLVLLIACLNVANLMLARATARERELAIRAALGASRWRIARQLLTESLALSLAGGLVGVLLSLWALELLVKIAPADIPRLAVIGLDGSVLAFALVISVLTGVLSGLAPILGTTRPDLAASIRSADKSGAAGTASRRLRSTLVAGEVAISLILLVAAGLLVRSLAQMEAFSWGFRPQNIVSARVAFLEERYATDTARVNFYRTLRDQLLAAPGIEAFGTSLDRIGTSWINLPFTAQGETYPNPGDRPPANYHIISPGYFDAVGLALQHGRNFSPDDDLDAPRVAIVDSNLARRHYPAGDAVGKTITVVTPEGDTPIEIVGIVGAVKFDGPAAAASRPDIYFPYLSFPQNNFYVHVRTPLAVGAAEALTQKKPSAKSTPTSPSPTSPAWSKSPPRPPPPAASRSASSAASPCSHSRSPPSAFTPSRNIQSRNAPAKSASAWPSAPNRAPSSRSSSSKVSAPSRSVSSSASSAPRSPPSRCANSFSTSPRSTSPPSPSFRSSSSPPPPSPASSPPAAPPASIH